MAMSITTTAAKSRLLCRLSCSLDNINNTKRCLSPSTLNFSTKSISPIRKPNNKKKKTNKKESSSSKSAASDAALKRRTRSSKEFDEEAVIKYGDSESHVPVMLGEVVDVFSCWKRPLRSFVDCTVGAAGHSSAIIQDHPELQLYVGMDVDPRAYEKARARIDAASRVDSSSLTSGLQSYTVLKNFRNIKSVIAEIDEELLRTGVDGILMDLGVSSMQVDDPKRGFSVLNNGPLDMRMDPKASLKAKDILNSWPEIEVGRILREYGEESNWYSLQNKIVKARALGGLHSTGDLVDLIRGSKPGMRGGRHGWIKTATRVFQALRIAVNDELKTLEVSLSACFDCLAPGGRLAVISFHSLEDRIVKKAFLDIVKSSGEDSDNENLVKIINDDDGKEAWIRQKVQGYNGTILTRRPITPTEEEERLNRRCRSAKLRVIEKGYR